MTRVRTFALPLLLTGSLLAACGDDSTEPAATTPAVMPQLDGRTFLSTGSTGFVLVDGTRVRLTFADGNVGASAGCNQMGGAYQVVDGVLVVDSLATTDMACEEPLMDQDQMLADLLTGGPAVRLVGDTLTLTVPDATLTLLDREVADPDRPIEGTTWIVEGVIERDAVWAGWGDAVATVRIVDGRAEVMAGCNRGGASVEVGDGVLTFGPLGLTKMACADEVMALERAVVTVLDGGTVTATVEADVLTLTNGENGLQLRAEE